MDDEQVGKIRAGAGEMFVWFNEFVRAGFTEVQALRLCGQIISTHIVKGQQQEGTET